MRVELQGGEYAIIRKRGEITQRASNAISRAFVRTAAIVEKLQALGYNTATPEQSAALLAHLTDDEFETMDAYQGVLIEAFVKEWSLGALPTAATSLDLPRGTFEALAMACATEYGNATDFSPDGVADPLAATGA